jgi:feruloyl-CoA hydratase/lyase
MRVRRSSATWQFHQLAHYLKPTIAMVNGWCFGGAFTPLISCDLAIAAEEAQFGVSEINWGIIPGGQVTKSLVFAMSFRNAMYYTLTGETFDGKQAAQMGIVNEAVPKAKLRERTKALADTLKGKNPHTLRACKEAIRSCMNIPWESSGDYLAAKSMQLRLVDDENGRTAGLTQFLDEKSYRPGLGAMRREKK